MSYAKEIKPYKEEIKIGDWIYKDGHIMKLDDLNWNHDNWTKITDKRKIEVLESILNK